MSINLAPIYQPPSENEVYSKQDVSNLHLYDLKSKVSEQTSLVDVRLTSVNSSLTSQTTSLSDKLDEVKSSANAIKVAVDEEKTALVDSLSDVESKVSEQTTLLNTKLSSVETKQDNANMSLLSIDSHASTSAQKLTSIEDKCATEAKQDDQITSLNVINTTLLNGLTISQAPSQSYFKSSSDTASENAGNIKGSSAKVWSVVCSNMAAGINAKRKYCKFYNTATSPNIYMDMPVIVLPIDVGASEKLDFNGSGMLFPAGLSFIFSDYAHDEGEILSNGVREVKLAVSYS